MGRDARLNADAVATGDGGNVAIWSNDGTRFYGRICARGGSESGSGGFVEVSGKRYLDYGGLTDTRAPMGSMGTLLLDPDDINIVVGVAGTDVNINCTGGGTCAAPLLGPFTDTVLLAGSVGTLNDGTLNAQLAINNVDVTATGAITSANAVNVNMSGRTLNLNAGSSITLGGTYSNGNLGLNFTTNLNLQANTYDVTGATVIANGGGAGTILGPNEAAAWNISGITGSLSSASGTIDFSGVSTLQGGSAVDTFTLGSASTFNLKGGDGLDVFALGGNWLTGSIAGEAAGGSITGIGSATLTAVGTTAGFNGTSANVSGGFTDISDLSGSGTLQGLDAVSSWATNGTSGTYTSTNALTFSGFGTAQGGNQADTFNVTAATTLNLKGGAGNDVFDIGAALTGSVNGETGSNTLQGSQISDVTLSGSAADGYAGTTAAVSGGFTNIRTFTGSGAGTLTGENAVSTWNLGASKTYDDNAGNGTLTFSGFANAQKKTPKAAAKTIRSTSQRPPRSTSRAVWATTSSTSMRRSLVRLMAKAAPIRLRAARAM